MNQPNTMNRNRFWEAEVKFFTHCPFRVYGEEQPLGEALHLAEEPLGICLLIAETEEKKYLDMSDELFGIYTFI